MSTPASHSENAHVLNTFGLTYKTHLYFECLEKLIRKVSYGEIFSFLLGTDIDVLRGNILLYCCKILSR